MFEEALRQAIIESGLSAYEIAKRAGERGEKISHQAIGRFMNKRKPGLNLCTAGVIADVLGLTIVKRGEAPPCEPPVDYRMRMHEEAASLAWQMFQRLGAASLDSIQVELARTGD
jgi:hypothetical protein